MKNQGRKSIAEIPNTFPVREERETFPANSCEEFRGLNSSLLTLPAAIGAPGP